MPNPSKFKNKKKWMEQCMHQTVTVEKKDPSQGLAQCLNIWRENRRKKTSSENFSIADTLRIYAGEILSQVICGKCRKSFDYGSQPEISMGAVKCPYCGAVVDQTGKVLRK